MSISPEKTLSETQIYAGTMVDLHLRQAELADGTTVQREIVRTRGGVVIVPMTLDHQVRLIRQYRVAAETWIIELPAGTLNRGEDPAVAAPRELLEETGDRAKTWHNLGGFYTAPGIVDEWLHLFLAIDLTPGPTQLDFDEHIEVMTIAWSAAVEMLRRGDIVDAKSIAALTKAALFLNLPF